MLRARLTLKGRSTTRRHSSPFPLEASWVEETSVHYSTSFSRATGNCFDGSFIVQAYFCSVDAPPSSTDTRQDTEASINKPLLSPYALHPASAQSDSPIEQVGVRTPSVSTARGIRVQDGSGSTLLSLAECRVNQCFCSPSMFYLSFPTLSSEEKLPLVL